MTIAARLLWPTRSLLGEAPLWSPADGMLHYVDIKGGAIHRYHPASGLHETTAVDARPSFIVPVEGGGTLVGSGDGLFLAHRSGMGDRLATISMPHHNRTNDATVDCHGRLWFGTMDDDEQLPTGSIYCLHDGVPVLMGCDAIVTNGPAVSADGRTLYHVDSVNRRIWRHVVEDGPKLSKPELFLQLEEADGHPDGIVLDSENCLWVALWDGWGVQRHAPDGSLLARVDLPCARVTKIAFGGEDLRTTYVTTASIGLSDTELADQPLAGGLFTFDAPVAGVPMAAVRLAAQV